MYWVGQIGCGNLGVRHHERKWWPQGIRASVVRKERPPRISGIEHRPDTRNFRLKNVLLDQPRRLISRDRDNDRACGCHSDLEIREADGRKAAMQHVNNALQLVAAPVLVTS